MYKMILLTSVTSPMMKHPMTLGLTLIVQTTLMSMSMFQKSSLTWYSYILYITMIGGLMIMFMYMSSIASNEKFKPNKKFLILIVIIFIIMMNVKENEPTMNTQIMEFKKWDMNQMEEVKSTSKFFNSKKNYITMIMISIMLLTMVSITNISNSFEGPLKKTYVYP
uniref:NADH dehydrogenase subunit 6 n=1 Tax=Flata truncata TaxID=3081121 RepID=UPI002A802CD8|nr:NADH dehydrogenase subunit 6 [Flata truncata]WOW99058.1 NADH dehydrogenase subunit 6 [Flata truncata]